jgi:di/tricarboxylate transporter
MMRAGIWFNLVSIALITVVASWLLPLAIG